MSSQPNPTSFHPISYLGRAIVSLAAVAVVSLHLPSNAPAQGATTDLLLVNGRLPDSSSIDYLVQFSGGGYPTSLSLNGVQAQIDVLERRPDGSARVFRGLAPMPGSFSPAVATATEAVPGNLHPLSGVYSGNANPTLLTFSLVNRIGTYNAALSTATNVEQIIGPGNVRGHSGGDYLRVTRYFCPFAHYSGGSPTALEQTCGAMIVYVTQRVDLDGYLVECLFANSSLATPVTTYSGDTAANPGHIVYHALSFRHGLANNYAIQHADTFTGTGGTQGNSLVKSMGSGQKHLSAPGTAPGWMFAIYNNNTTPGTRVIGMLEGKDNAIAFSGRGFHTGSPYGFGPNELRHDDPDSWAPADSRNAMRTRVLGDLATLKDRLLNGTIGGGLTTSRMGVYQCFGDADPGGPGGSGISGHFLEDPVPEYVAILRLGSMMATRRANHSFYQWNGSRPLLPADAAVDWTDPTTNEVGTIKVSMLHTGDPAGGASSSPIPSTQFACVSPTGATIGFRSNGGPVNQQGTNGPSGRVWNQLGVGETLPFAAEDAASWVGYSHDLAHSPRFFVAREAYLFGLSMLGYDLAQTFAAHAACYHLAYDVDASHADWRFARAGRNLHALGNRDLLGITKYSGRPNARRRDDTGQLGPLHTASGSQNVGQQQLGHITSRTLAWSMIWQFSGSSIGNDSYRAATTAHPTLRFNPARLFAAFVERVQTAVGVTSQLQQNIHDKKPYDDSPENGGATNLSARTGGLPYGGTDGAYWTMTVGFQDVYFTMAVDAVARHLSTTSAAALQPTRERVFWQLVQNQTNAHPVTGQIGIPPCPPASVGTLGLGANVFDPANPVATENDLRTDVARWTYSNSATSPDAPMSGWGYELPNTSLGALMALRGMTPAKRAGYGILLRKQFGLQPTDSTAALLAAVRSAAGTLYRARVRPFLAEASAYLP